MVRDEELINEGATVAPTYGQIPRSGRGRDKERAGDGTQANDGGDLVAPGRSVRRQEKRDDQSWNGDSDQSLGEQSDPQEDVEPRPRAAKLALGRGLVHPVEAGERCKDGRRNWRLKGCGPSETDEKGIDGECGGGGGGESVAAGAAEPGPQRPNYAGGEDRRRKPRRPFSCAEDAVARPHQPIRQNGFFKPGSSKQGRGNPIPADGHFIRDLSVARLVRAEKSGRAEPEKERDRAHGENPA